MVDVSSVGKAIADEIETHGHYAGLHSLAPYKPGLRCIVISNAYDALSYDEACIFANAMGFNTLNPGEFLVGFNDTNDLATILERLRSL